MADGPRKSSRPVKIKRDPDFIYDSESSNFLNGSDIRHSSFSVSKEDSAEVLEYNNGKDTADSISLDWAEIYGIPLLNNRAKYTVSESSVSIEGSSSQSQTSHQDSQNSQLFAPEFVYPSDPEVGGAVVCRHNSSTRYSF